MNFSINKLNDASVLALLECDTPVFKGLMLYPVPFMGEDDASTVKLIKDTCRPREADEDDEDHEIKIVDYHVIFNLTPYSPAVANMFMRTGRLTEQGLLILSCNVDVLKYALTAVSLDWYKTLHPTDEVKSVFETIDPLKIAKYAMYLRDHP